MKKTVRLILSVISFAILLIINGCSPEPQKNVAPTATDMKETAQPTQSSTQAATSVNTQEAEKTTEAPYLNITQEEAKKIMDSGVDHIILDVRTEEEYNQGHIANAILIPHTEILTKAESEIADKDTLILVYCRSGNRSKTASEYLLELGYTKIREFGGIIDWQYGIVS